MQTSTAQDVITQKTRELCQAILDQPEFQDMRRRIDLFMGDEQAKTAYRLATEKGEFLQHKQQQGSTLSPQEIADFEKYRDAALGNSVTRDFLDAQEQIHKTQESVNQHVGKTFELGRVPTEDDFDSGSCGHGCGCHH